MDDRELDKLMSASAVRQVQLLNNSLPSDEIDNTDSSEDFTQYMKMLISKDEKKRKSRKRLGKIIASFAIIAIVSFGAIMSASANRAYFFQMFDRSFNISGQQNDGWNTKFNAQVADNCHNVYLPSWVPDGIKASESSQEEEQCTITYKGNNQTIRFIQSKDTSILNDNKVDSMEKLTVQNQIYYYSEKNRSGSITRKLIWVTESNSFELDTTGGKDELLKIAQSLVFKKG